MTRKTITGRGRKFPPNWMYGSLLLESERLNRRKRNMNSAIFWVIMCPTLFFLFVALEMCQ